MVQINRGSLLASRTRALRRGLSGIVRFTLISAAMPLVFFLRLSPQFHRSQPSGYLRSQPSGYLKVDPVVHQVFVQYNSQYARLMTILQLLECSAFFHGSRTSSEHGSIVELDYCQFPPFPSITQIIRQPTNETFWLTQFTRQPTNELFWLNFTAWASPILNQTMEALFQRSDVDLTSLSAEKHQNLKSSSPQSSSLETEWLLQLLEMYAQDHPLHLCDYSSYKPTVPSSSTTNSPDRSQVARTLTRLSHKYQQSNKSPKSLSLVISIVAHTDLHHLQKLIHSLPSKDTLILIHLERPRDEQARLFEQALRKWIATDKKASLQHVHVLSFGTVLYGTSSVTQIQWRILNWLLNEVQLPFEYFMTLDGASFPLWKPDKLLARLADASERSKDSATSKGGNVWLGPMLHKGESTIPTEESDVSSSLPLLRNKRLLYTTMTSTTTTKVTQRLPRNLFAHQSIPTNIAHALLYKSHSGNTAVYHRSVVDKFVRSSDVQQLMAWSKYAANCCLEEHVWVAAMILVGEPVPDQSAVLQAYGGTSATCESSKRNALWTRNATICYKVEDAKLVQNSHGLHDKQSPILLSKNDTAGGYVLNGNATVPLLQMAKELDFLFARKFDSSHAGSRDMVDYIQENIW